MDNQWTSTAITDVSGSYTSQCFGQTLTQCGMTVKYKCDASDPEWCTFYVFPSSCGPYNIMNAGEAASFKAMFRRFCVKKICVKVQFHQPPMNKFGSAFGPMLAVTDAAGVSSGAQIYRASGQYQHYTLPNPMQKSLVDAQVLNDTQWEAAKDQMHTVKIHKTGTSYSMAWRPQAQTVVDIPGGAGNQIKPPCGQAYIDGNTFFASASSVQYTGPCAVFKIRKPSTSTGGPAVNWAPVFGMDIYVRYYIHAAGRNGYANFDPWGDG